MKIKQTLLIFLAFCALSWMWPDKAYADVWEMEEVPLPQLTVEGTVIDHDGEPLIGVNIQVKGSTKGTATDFDGRFALEDVEQDAVDRKSTRLNSSHVAISYAVFCLKKKNE